MQVKATARGIIAQFDTVLTGRGRGVHDTHGEPARLIIIVKMATDSLLAK